MKYTIVIPAYNAANCIGEMLDGLCHQTQGDFEVVVVNDGSTDDLESVISEWKDAFAVAGHSLVLIDKDVNAGLAEARNSGLDWVTETENTSLSSVGQANHTGFGQTVETERSDYILFLDADDSVEPDLLEHLDPVCDGKTDFVIFGYTEDYYEGEKLSYRVTKTQEACTFAKPCEEMYLRVLALEQETMFGYAWNKAYRVAFLEEQGFRFETVTHIEDILFNIGIARHMQSMAVVDAPLYHYANRGQARLTSKYLPEYFVMQKRRITEFLSLMEEKLTKEGDLNQAYKAMAAVYFRSFFSAVTRDLNHGEDRKEILNKIETEEKDELFNRLVPYARFTSKATQFIYKPILLQKNNIVMRRAKMIAFVQKHFSGLFNRLKQKR